MKIATDDALRQSWITRSYVLGLSLIAILSLCSHLLMEQMLKEQEGAASVVNQSGRQRMLSQRVARLALQYVEGDVDAERAAALPVLAESLAAMSIAHESLTAGESATAPAHRMQMPLWQIYFAEPVQLDAQVRDYLATGRRLAGRNERDPVADRADLKRLLDAAGSRLMTGLDAAVHEYQSESEASVGFLRRVQYALLALILLTLTGEALLIFRPMVARIRRSHLRLDNARAELQTVFDGVPDSIFVLSESLLVNRCNRAAARLWDCELGEMLGRPLVTLMPGADSTLRTVRRRAGFQQTQELVAVRGDGSRFPFECRLSEHPHGGFLLTGRDVSERREQEHRLRLYESAFMNATDPILIFEDRTGVGRIDTIAYVNPAFTQITGFQPGHVVAQGIQQLLPEETDNEVRLRITTAFISRVPTQLETPLRRRDGSQIWCELTFMPAPDAKGTVGHIVVIVRDISERRERERKAWEQGNLDLLTGLPNRRLFGERLRQALEDADRQGHTVALLFIDLDGFKAVNDRHGHDAGDQLLKNVAQRLIGSVRGADVVSRLAGDEFTVICPHLEDAAVAEQIAQKIIDHLGQPVELLTGNASIGASIGIAVFPSDATTVARLIKLADDAMYAAKSGGKNTYRLASRLTAPTGATE